MRKIFIEELLKYAHEDSRIILVTGDLGYGVVDQFAKELPNQFVNFGINEQSMMSAAAGMAKKGLKPFVYSIGNFPTFRCLEQVRNDVCYMNLDVTIVAVGAGLAYGTAGYSHHLIEDISALSGLPNLQIYSPADDLETKLVLQLIKEYSGPKYIRLGKGGEGDLTNLFDQSSSGYSQLNGSQECLILSTGNILSEAIELRKLMSTHNPTISSIFSLQRLKGLLSAHHFPRIITVEEHILRGGFGSLVKEILQESNSHIKSFGIHKIESSLSGSQSYLRDSYEISSRAIFRSIVNSKFLE